MTPHGCPPDQYHCLLDEQPYYLVPPRLYGEGCSREAIVNPHCWFTWHGPLPAEKAMRVGGAEYLMPGDWVVWVDDPATRSIWPYWMGAEYASYLSQFVPGMVVDRSTLPPLMSWVLERAHILVDFDFHERRRRDWLNAVWECAREFERGYTSLAGLIPPFHIGALRRYYRYHTRAGSFALGDSQVARRHVAHNEVVASFVHSQLTGVVSDVARRLTRPSYSYLAAYESGSVLDRHTDREQCEYSITMCIDAAPEPGAQVPWPIELDVPDGSLRIWQHLGDGLLYRGRYLAHSRQELAHGYTSTSLLFHYVDHDFGGQLN
jgi:hypothetical protein